MGTITFITIIDAAYGLGAVITGTSATQVATVTGRSGLVRLVIEVHSRWGGGLTGTLVTAHHGPVAFFVKR